MGLFEKIFSRPQKPLQIAGPWKTLTAYQPAFRTWDGQLYESELVRAAVDALARHSSKLAVTFNGPARPKLKNQMRVAPNGFQTWGQFLYRTRTILEMQGTAFIVPVLDEFGDLTGYFSLLPSQCEIVKGPDNTPYLRYNFMSDSRRAAIELYRCGVITKHQYKDDVFGTGNKALSGTMELINMQRQGIEEGVKNGATFRFMARMTNFVRPDDLKKERQRFNAENLQDESGGILLFPNTYSDVQQIKSTPFTVDADQVKLIQNNVCNYFGVSEDVLQNKVTGDTWDAFYEGAVEPFAIQLGDVMSRMTYTQREIATGNNVFISANRLQYMSTEAKLKVSAQLMDRGIINRDEAREIWNLPPLPNGEGQHYMVLAEYVNAAGQAAPEGDKDAN